MLRSKRDQAQTDGIFLAGTAVNRIRDWLESFPEHDGIRLLSPPRHFGGTEGGEADYAEQFVVDEEFERQMGAGLVRALNDVGAERGGPALELGSGTGIFSRGLIAATDYPSYLISDMSPDFLALTRKSLASIPAADRAEYLCLNTDDLGSWPAATLSMVALRFALHHVLDWERFIAEAAQCLRPGGVFVLEEPFADGYLLQAALADQLLRSPAPVDDLTNEVRADLRFFVDTTYWYLRTGVDKELSEDKHVFPAHQLLEVCRVAGLEPVLYPNVGFEHGLDGTAREAGYFEAEFRHNLKVNFGFGDETMAFFDRYLAPVCCGMELLDGAQRGPLVHGVVVARRTGDAAGTVPATTASKVRAAARSTADKVPVGLRAKVPVGVRRRVSDLMRQGSRQAQ